MLTDYLLTIRDESPIGELIHELNLSFDHPRVSARDIIETRVREEVAAYNSRVDGHFHGLVTPTDAERRLNGQTGKGTHRIDADQQVEIVPHR